MRLVNPHIAKDLEQGKALRIDLGSGTMPRAGFYGLDQLMDEIHRIMRPGGLLEVVAPHFSNPHYYADPTHVRFFGL